MNARRLFLKELKMEYTGRFIFILFLTLLILFIPVIILFLTGIVRFDPAQFVNLYLSTIFTSILIAFTIQILEVYRKSQMSVTKIKRQLEIFNSFLTLLSAHIKEGNLNRAAGKEAFIVYRRDLLTYTIVDPEFASSVIGLNSLNEFDYLIETLSANDEWNPQKISSIQNKIKAIQTSITSIITEE